MNNLLPPPHDEPRDISTKKHKYFREMFLLFFSSTHHLAVCTVLFNRRPRLTFKVKVTIYVGQDTVPERKSVMKRDVEEVRFVAGFAGELKG